MKAKTLPILVLAALMAAGCNKTLYSNLSESDANQMLSTLLQRGIEAQKISDGKNGYSIEVGEEDLILALEIIEEHSLPRTRFESLGSVFSGQGMISSQTEEQARLAYALSQELSSTFSQIDGVLDARVHVVLVQHEQASGVTTPPSAAVYIRHTKDSAAPSLLSDIKDTAARAVPGLTHDRVSVMLEEFKEQIIKPKPKEKHWYEGPVALAAAAVLGAGAMAIAFLLLLRSKGFLPALLGNAGQGKSEESKQDKD